MKGLPVAALVASMSFALPSGAALLQGPAFIKATTTVPPCGFFPCQNFGTNINEIADGSDANLNGYAGQTGVLGTIDLDLLGGTYDLSSFLLWNDVNVVNEGVRSFRLNFYDAAEQLITSTGVLSAVSQFAAQTYTFSTVAGVGRVGLEVLSVSARIEIREVAFNGAPAGAGAVPEPASLALAGLALAAAAATARRHRR